MHRSRNIIAALLLAVACTPAFAAYRSSTNNPGTGPTVLSTTVPAGVAVDDIVILTATLDGAGAVFDPADWPTGFTELCEVDITNDGQSVAVGWKRLTGVDSGSYTFGEIGQSTSPWLVQAFAFSGRHTTSPPVATFCNDISNAANTSPVTVTASSITAVAGDDLLWVSAPDINTSGAGTGHTAPSGFTEQQDAENLFADLTGATQDNVSGGATGAISGTFTMTGGTAGWAAFLINIPTATVEGPPPPNAEEGSRLH